MTKATIELTNEQENAVYHFAGGMAITALATLVGDGESIASLDSSVRSSMEMFGIRCDDTTWGKSYFEFVTGLCNYRMHDSPSLENHYRIMSQMLSVAMASVLNSATDISVGLIPADGEFESELSRWISKEQ